MERVKNNLPGKVPRYFGHETGLRMTPLVCRPEQCEGPGLASGCLSPQILHASGIQNDTTRFFGHGPGLRMTGQDPSGGGTALRMTGLVVVLSSAKDLVLIVILNGVKNLVLLLKGPHPRFFMPSAFRMTGNNTPTPTPDPSSPAAAFRMT